MTLYLCVIEDAEYSFSPILSHLVPALLKRADADCGNEDTIIDIMLIKVAYELTNKSKIVCGAPDNLLHSVTHALSKVTAQNRVRISLRQHNIPLPISDQAVRESAAEIVNAAGENRFCLSDIWLIHPGVHEEIANDCPAEMCNASEITKLAFEIHDLLDKDRRCLLYTIWTEDGLLDDIGKCFDQRYPDLDFYCHVTTKEQVAESLTKINADRVYRQALQLAQTQQNGGAL